jgi:hypothetical protein
MGQATIRSARISPVLIRSCRRGHWLGVMDSGSAAMREMHGYTEIDDVAVARLEFRHGSAALA